MHAKFFMVIVVKSVCGSQKDFFINNIPPGTTLMFRQPGEILYAIGADVYFDFTFENENEATSDFIENKPVFVNAIKTTCIEINKPNYIRINAWHGFLEQQPLELVCNDELYKQKAETIFNAFGWKYVWTPDEPGFISARIISMIINEAWFALGEEVSSKEEIDTAMKLGTNYPHGPFEWCEKIGIKNIYSLLKKLQTNNSRYEIAPLLTQEAIK